MMDESPASSRIAEKIREVEMAASLQRPATPEQDNDDGGLWFAIGAGISTAVIAAAVAMT